MRPHPKLIVCYAGQVQAITFPCTSRSRRAPAEAAAKLRRLLKGMEQASLNLEQQTTRAAPTTPATTAIDILGVEVTAIHYRGEPVVTFAMVDKIHQRPDGTAGRTFRENRARFVEGEDFTSASIDEIRRLAPALAEGRSGGKPIIFLTRRGYLKLVKPLTDDRAWAVQGEMIDRYFLVEEIAKAIGGGDEVLGAIGQIETKVTKLGNGIAGAVNGYVTASHDSVIDTMLHNGEARAKIWGQAP